MGSPLPQGQAIWSFVAIVDGYIHRTQEGQRASQGVAVDYEEVDS